MLKIMMEFRGKFPNKMLKKATFLSKHFESDFRFKDRELDSKGQERVRVVNIPSIPPRDVGSMIDVPAGSDSSTLSLYGQFKDLLDKMLALDPTKRLSLDEALEHPFVTGKIIKK